MWILVSAIVTASLLGSMHCVGMCGPLAIWASGAGQRFSTRQMALATSAYHLGRLLTYALVGVLAGAVGQLLDVGGQTLGIQLLTARLVGGLMIVVGGWRLVQLARSQLGRTSAPVAIASPQPGLVTRWLLRLRPYVFQLPLAVRGVVTGLLTPLLPCGWLYLFALVAAGTGSVVMGGVVMVAFWIGTVPALVGLVTSTQILATRFQRAIPAAAAALLLVGGCYTAAGRGFASLHSLSDIRWQGDTQFARQALETPSSQDTLESSQVTAALSELTHTPLPCCAVHAGTQTTSAASTDSILPIAEGTPIAESNSAAEGAAGEGNPLP